LRQARFNLLFQVVEQVVGNRFAVDDLCGHVEAARKKRYFSRFNLTGYEVSAIVCSPRGVA
jgi:hypothetical protein